MDLVLKKPVLLNFDTQAMALSFSLILSILISIPIKPQF